MGQAGGCTSAGRQERCTVAAAGRNSARPAEHMSLLVPDASGCVRLDSHAAVCQSNFNLAAALFCHARLPPIPIPPSHHPPTPPRPAHPTGGAGQRRAAGQPHPVWRLCGAGPQPGGAPEGAAAAGAGGEGRCALGKPGGGVGGSRTRGAGVHYWHAHQLLSPQHFHCTPASAPPPPTPNPRPSCCSWPPRRCTCCRCCPRGASSSCTPSARTAG